MADYTDAQMVGDLSKITEEASYLLDRDHTRLGDEPTPKGRRASSF